VKAASEGAGISFLERLSFCYLFSVSGHGKIFDMTFVYGIGKRFSQAEPVGA